MESSVTIRTGALPIHLIRFCSAPFFSFLFVTFFFRGATGRERAGNAKGGAGTCRAPPRKKKSEIVTAKGKRREAEAFVFRLILSRFLFCDVPSGPTTMPPHELSIFVATWNVNGKMVKDDLSTWLTPPGTGRTFLSCFFAASSSHTALSSSFLSRTRSETGPLRARVPGV